jgi:molybdate transport system ATP-binding protein
MSVDVRLAHNFGGFALDVRFTVERPGVTALFGPSGAGKSTIVNAIAGTFRPQLGRIAINGRTVFDSSNNVWLSPMVRRTGYVFQDSRLFPHMSVEDNLLFGWRRARNKAGAGEIANVISLLGLDDLRQRKPANLSGGEKGRVALGRALLSSPEILLLDEPLAALDAERRMEILPYLERLRDEARLPMLYVSHQLDEVARLAHDIVVLRGGQVVRKGSVFDVLTELELPTLAGTSPVGAVIEARVGERRADSLTAGVRQRHLARQEVKRRRARAARGSRQSCWRLEEPRTISANNVLLGQVADRATPMHACSFCAARPGWWHASSRIAGTAKTSPGSGLRHHQVHDGRRADGGCLKRWPPPRL